MKYQALVVDDEPKMRKALLLLLERNCPEIIVCGLAASAHEARLILKTQKVDFIFLDISMPEENGFKFLRSIPSENYGIIFTAVHQKYALRAIKANAIEFLLKPVDTLELKKAVLKAIKYYKIKSKPETRKSFSESLDKMHQQIMPIVEKISKITVPEQYGFRVINLDELMYLQADSNYTILHLVGLNKIVAHRALAEFEKILINREFFRIHQSTIINMNYLKTYTSYQGDSVLLTDGTLLTISRKKLNEFHGAIQHFSASADKI